MPKSASYRVAPSSRSHEPLPVRSVPCRHHVWIVILGRGSLGGARFVILGEGNVDTVDFLVVLLALFRGECVRLLGLLWSNAGIIAAVAFFCVFQSSKVHQRLRLDLLVLIALHAHTVVRSLGCDLARRLLHRRFSRLRWTCKS